MLKGIDKRILWLIVARSGSKGIPDKNKKTLNGQPLLAYRIKSALEISNKEDVWVSTDSMEYAEIATQFGATIPFIRPSELATDQASSMDVVLHAMDYAEKNGLKYDAVGLLEPTSPFVKADSLQNAVKQLFEDAESNSIVAVKEVETNSIFVQKDAKYLIDIAKNITESQIIRRQDATKEITPSGGFYISKWNEMRKYKTYYTSRTLAYELKGVQGLEIDELIDFQWAEFVVANHLCN